MIILLDDCVKLIYSDNTLSLIFKIKTKSILYATLMEVAVIFITYNVA